MLERNSNLKIKFHLNYANECTPKQTSSNCSFEIGSDYELRVPYSEHCYKV